VSAAFLLLPTFSRPVVRPPAVLSAVRRLACAAPGRDELLLGRGDPAPRDLVEPADRAFAAGRPAPRLCDFADERAADAPRPLATAVFELVAFLVDSDLAAWPFFTAPADFADLVLERPAALVPPPLRAAFDLIAIVASPVRDTDGLNFRGRNANGQKLPVPKRTGPRAGARGPGMGISSPFTCEAHYTA
jgi:hypothetical protein